MSRKASNKPVKRESKAIAAIHRDAILERIRGGEILREIAPTYKVSGQAIWKVLKDDPEYREALKDQAESMVDEAKAALWAAREQVEIARAREMGRFAIRYAETVFKEKWSPHHTVEVSQGHGWGDRLRRARERVIDVAPQPEGELSTGDSPTQQADSA